MSLDIVTSDDEDRRYDSAVELQDLGSHDTGGESKPEFDPIPTPKPRKPINMSYLISAIVGILVLATFTIVVVVQVALAPPAQKVVVLVSVDGFSWDYLVSRYYPTPNLDLFRAAGITAQLHPEFPSKTYPNQYSIVTGLYPAWHGIIENVFWDPDLQAEFNLNVPESMLNPAFWHGEPIWDTANRSGLVTASWGWPGSETYIGGLRPTFVKPNNTSVPSITRVEQVLNWLDSPSTKRPSLITMYFSAVDSAGHRYGPNSADVAAAVADLDNSLSVLFYGISARQGPLDISVIVVSDHGMQVVIGPILIDQYLSPEILAQIYIPDINTPIANLWLPDDLVDSAMQQLKFLKHATAYLKEDLPSNYYLNDSNRVAPIVIISEIGYLITTYDIMARHPALLTGGSHGWDPINYNMTGIFIAQGKRFPKTSETLSFRNLEVYNIICDLLEITPSPNNGTYPYYPGVMNAATPAN